MSAGCASAQFTYPLFLTVSRVPVTI